MPLTLNEILIIFAVLAAPLIAVQVQKWLEIYRESKARKLWIFKTLMATRASTVSQDHVQALNMIDLEFRGKRYSEVTTTWKTYLDHLGSFPDNDESMQPVWRDRRIDLLTELLFRMGKSLGYEFDNVHLRKGIYAPEAHGRLEEENFLIRQGLLKVLYGEEELKMKLTNLPESETAAADQEAIRAALIQLLEGKRALSISMHNEDGSDFAADKEPSN